MAHDEVSNPQHYNRSGLEVIDVIETYAKEDFRLANVIKYVCRCEYKGKKLQDLQKAAWYLDRVINELEVAEARGAFEDARREFLEDTEDLFEEPATDAYGRALRASPAINIDGDEVDENGDLLHERVYSVEQVEAFFAGYDYAKDEDCTPFVHTSRDRIAGDDENARRIKDGYYDFDRFEILGYCVQCDAELLADRPFVKIYRDYSELYFCSPRCVEYFEDGEK